MDANSTMNSGNSTGMDMGGMDMGGDCKSENSIFCHVHAVNIGIDGVVSVSMLWNWYTVDACFLSASWQVETKGMFAGTIIGIFCLTCAIELVRRIARDYDRRLIRVAKVKTSPLFSWSYVVIG